MNIQDITTNIDADIQKLKDVRSQLDMKTGAIISQVEGDSESNDDVLDVGTQNKEIEVELEQLDGELNDAVLKFATKE